LIFDVLVKGGAKGVSGKDVQRLKVMVGMSREKERDMARHAERVRKETDLANKKAELEEKVKEIAGMITDSDEALKKAEELAKSLPEVGADAKAQGVIGYTSQVDEALKPAKELITSTLDKINCMTRTEPSEQQHKGFIKDEVRKLQRRMADFESRATKVTTRLKKTRVEARKKVAGEMEYIRTYVLNTIRWYQQMQKLTVDALFAEIDADGDSSIDEVEFLGFFSRCEERRKAEDAKAEVAKAEAAKSEDVKVEDIKDEDAKVEDIKDEDVKVEDIKDEDAEVIDVDDVKVEEVQDDEPGPSVDVEPGPPVDVEPGPSVEDLQRLFTQLDEDGQKRIPQEVFMRFIRRYMKVVKDTVMSAGIGIKEKVVRRLELKEVVEVLQGPMKEEESGVDRVQARAMSDAAIGWISIAGNQKSVYLEDGGAIFKVVKETILTGSFELAVTKGVTRKLHDTTRKLVPDELVEVYEWPKLEETSGLTRMKCRVRSDGQVGWVTTIGNQGALFLEVA